MQELRNRNVSTGLAVHKGLNRYCILCSIKVNKAHKRWKAEDFFQTFSSHECKSGVTYKVKSCKGRCTCLWAVALRSKVFSPNGLIGPLHDPVTWYGINYAGTQVTQWDFQNKGKSGWTGTSSFVLEVASQHNVTGSCKGPTGDTKQE